METESTYNSTSSSSVDFINICNLTRILEAFMTLESSQKSCSAIGVLIKNSRLLVIICDNDHLDIKSDI